MIGYGVSGVDHDFFAFNSAGNVWNGSSFVAWNNANYATYRIAATEVGASGRYGAAMPANTITYELRVRASTLADSHIVWADNISDSSGVTTLLSRVVGTLASGTHQPQTGDSFARLGAPAGASIAADIQTRLPTASYTAPPTASQNATQVRTELTTELSRIDATVSSRLSTLGTNAPADWINAAAIASNAITDTKINTGALTSAKFASGAFDAVWTVGTRTITGGTVTTVSDKTGYSLSQAFPSNFAALGINSSGHVSRVTLVDTTSVNTDMRGTDNAIATGVSYRHTNNDTSESVDVTIIVTP